MGHVLQLRKKNLLAILDPSERDREPSNIKWKFDSIYGVLVGSKIVENCSMLYDRCSLEGERIDEFVERGRDVGGHDDYDDEDLQR